MDVATHRAFRRVVCPVCGERRTEMRVFGASREDEGGRRKSWWQLRRELHAQADAWHPAPVCDRCAR